MRSVAILDYGAGNISSVNRFFLNDLSCNTSVISIEDFKANKDEILIIPGVGHFGAAAKRLNCRDSYDMIKEFAYSGKCIIGICLGAQILTLGSEEADPEDKGIGLVPMYCRSLKEHKDYKGKVPRTGWGTVRHIDREREYYFVHSYYLSGGLASNELLRIDKCVEDGVPAYVSMKDLQVHAIQFHPEKSGDNGFEFVKRILENA